MYSTIQFSFKLNFAEVNRNGIRNVTSGLRVSPINVKQPHIHFTSVRAVVA